MSHVLLPNLDQIVQASANYTLFSCILFDIALTYRVIPEIGNCGYQESAKNWAQGKFNKAFYQRFTHVDVIL